MSSNPCLQCGQDPCSQCPETPCIPVAPPPSCGAGSAACDEYILSDCVVSTIDGSCTVVIQTPDGPVTVGLQITEGMTLTNILNQLTSTACIFDPAMIQGFWTSIFNNTTLFEWIVTNFFTELFNNTTLFQWFVDNFFTSIINNPITNQFFTNIICGIECEDPCDKVDGVEQMVFTDITLDEFNMNWIGMPGYTYFIRINDSQSSPTTYYEYTTPTAPVPGPPANNIPGPVVLNTAVFSKYENGVLVANNGLASNTSFEVYITAIKLINNLPVACETGPFTIITLEDTACALCTTTIDVQNSNSNPAGPGELSIDIAFQAGPFPLGYNIIVTSVTTNLVVNGPPTGVFITPSPGFITNYNILLPGDDYNILVTPVCSLVPYCTGTPDNIVVTVDPAAFCAPPDITVVSINS